jgi:hypothetical protein
VSYKEFTNQLETTYEIFREKSLRHRRFKHSDIRSLIEKLKDNKLFSVKELGESAQKREIYLVSIGTGKIKVFLWSQMHGDESTATMALFDIFNFFSTENRFEDFKESILNKLTIYFLPMVNPDGAEVFERRNAFQIDLNRDALKLQTPEGKILNDTFNSISADFGFNLHDQSIYYCAGRNLKSAAISFLASATNYEKVVNPVRKKSMQLIGQLKTILDDYIPGHIGKFSDDFEPRAFGDNFQARGTSTILIESGGWKDDPEKQFLRKLNFIILLASFRSIAEKDYERENPDTYDKIPFNEKDAMMNLILRNLNYKIDSHIILIDIGINRTEINKDSAGSFYQIGRVADIGDLSVYKGYDDFDLKGMQIEYGKTYEKKISSVQELSNLNFIDLFSGGYTNVLVDFAVTEDFTKYPVNIICSGYENVSRINVDGPANFYIKKNDVIEFVIVNGFLIDLNNPQLDNANGEVVR